MYTNPQLKKIDEMIRPSLTDMGLELVRLMMTGSKYRPTLQIMLEKNDGQPVNIDDCGKASRHISALLDIEDPIAGVYDLEVSSTGIDRPLMKLKDFERFKGYDAKIELDRPYGVEPFANRKRFEGQIIGVKGDYIIFMQEGAEAILPFGWLDKAKLLITDELLKKHTQDTKKTGEEE